MKKASKLSHNKTFQARRTNPKTRFLTARINLAKLKNLRVLSKIEVYTLITILSQMVLSGKQYRNGPKIDPSKTQCVQ